MARSHGLCVCLRCVLNASVNWRHQPSFPVSPVAPSYSSTRPAVCCVAVSPIQLCQITVPPRPLLLSTAPNWLAWGRRGWAPPSARLGQLGLLQPLCLSTQIRGGGAFPPGRSETGGHHLRSAPYVTRIQRSHSQRCDESKM